MPAWLIPAAAGLQAIGNGISAAGDLESAKAMRRAMLPQLDANANLAQGAFDYVADPRTGKLIPYEQAGLQAMQGIQDWQGPEQGQFNYDRSVQSFLDPSMQFQQDQARKAIEAAAGPVVLSGGAMRSLNQRATDIAGQGYAKAMDWRNQDRSFVYQQFLNDFAARRQNALDQYAKLQTLLATGQNATNGMVSAKQAMTAQLANINEQRGQINGAVDAARAGLGYKIAGGLLGTAAQAAPAFVGAQQNQNWLDYFNNQGAAPAASVMPTPTRADYAGYGIDGSVLNPTEQAILRSNPNALDYIGKPAYNPVQQGMQAMPQGNIGTADPNRLDSQFLNLFPASRYTTPAPAYSLGRM